MVVPRYKCDDAEGSDDKEHEDDNEKGSTESRRPRIARGKRVMVVVVHFDSSGLDAAIATWIGWWVRIDYDSFAGLLRVSAQYAGRQVLRTAMLWSVKKMRSLRAGTVKELPPSRLATRPRHVTRLICARATADQARTFNLIATSFLS